MYERHPVLFIVDVSGEKNRQVVIESGERRRVIDLLNNGLNDFTREISEDPILTRRVDVSLVTFGGNVTIEQQFCPFKNTWGNSGPPTLTAKGSSPMCRAIIEGIEMLREHKDEIVDDGGLYSPASVWLLTEGRPNMTKGEIWETAQNAIRSGIYDEYLSFYAVVYGKDSGIETLAELVSEIDDPHANVSKFGVDQITDVFQIAADKI